MGLGVNAALRCLHRSVCIAGGRGTGSLASASFLRSSFFGFTTADFGRALPFGVAATSFGFAGSSLLRGCLGLYDPPRAL